MDILEIGKRKYSNTRKLCKPEGIIFPSYDHIAIFRSQIALTPKIKFIHKEGQNIGVTHSYFELVKHTAERIIRTVELNFHKIQSNLRLLMVRAVIGYIIN